MKKLSRLILGGLLATTSNASADHLISPNESSCICANTGYPAACYPPACAEGYSCQEDTTPTTLPNTTPTTIPNNPVCDANHFNFAFFYDPGATNGYPASPVTNTANSGSFPLCATQIFNTAAAICQGNLDQSTLGLAHCMRNNVFVLLGLPIEFASHSGQNIYMGSDCRATTSPNMYNSCPYYYLYLYGTPISLLMQPLEDLEKDATIVTFPIDPTGQKRFFTWKASKKAPLLVYDPEHRGNIVSASQLFGDWTFGGQRTASLVAGSMLPTKWENGFQALATLDRNGDKVLTGEELKPLGLWYDENRDGISQPGEVKNALDDGVIKISVVSDKVDPIHRSVIATNGFVMVRDGKEISGPAVDWYAAGGEDLSEAVSRALLKFASPEIADEHGQVTPIDSSESAVKTPKAVGKEVDSASIAGIWGWSADGRIGTGKRKGYLIISPLKDGEFSVLSPISIPSTEKDGKSGYLLNLVTFKGRYNGKSSDGRQTFSFETDRSAQIRSIISSEIVLSRNGDELLGTTVGKAHKDEKLGSVRYSWIARRVNNIGE